MKSTAVALALYALCGCTRADATLVMTQAEGEDWSFGTEKAPKVEGAEVMFAAVGDMGDANRMQAAIAESMQRVCDGHCQLVLLLGDNRYEAGLATSTDEAALQCIVDSYPTDFKYLVLGNHDYSPVQPKLSRARVELGWIRSAGGKEVGAHGSHHFYRFEVGPVRFVALDTNYLVRGRMDERYQQIVQGMGWMRRRDDGWTIVFGHHPVISNGPHGNAGAYLDGGFSIWQGRFFRYFMQEYVLGRAELYISGHDHSQQFYAGLLGKDTAEVVAGSGSRCTGRGSGDDNEPWLESYGHGFALVNASKERLTVRYYGYDGTLLWGVSRTHDSGWHPLPGYPPRHRLQVNLCDIEQSKVREMREPSEGCFSR